MCRSKRDLEMSVWRWDWKVLEDGTVYVQNAQVRDGPETRIIFPIGPLPTLYDTVQILKCIKATFQWNLFLLLFLSRNMPVPMDSHQEWVYT